jgi:hypothetical protein
MGENNQFPESSWDWGLRLRNITTHAGLLVCLRLQKREITSQNAFIQREVKRLCQFGEINELKCSQP